MQHYNGQSYTLIKQTLHNVDYYTTIAESNGLVGYLVGV
jgi:hypothetical protein